MMKKILNKIWGFIKSTLGTLTSIFVLLIVLFSGSIILEGIGLVGCVLALFFLGVFCVFLFPIGFTYFRKIRTSIFVRGEAKQEMMTEINKTLEEHRRGLEYITPFAISALVMITLVIVGLLLKHHIKVLVNEKLPAIGMFLEKHLSSTIIDGTPYPVFAIAFICAFIVLVVYLSKSERRRYKKCMSKYE